MKTFKSVLPILLIFLVVSLACNALLPSQAGSPSRIAYSLFVPGEGIFIHAVEADGRNDVRLTGNDCLGALPKWSNDGSLIAYYCYDPDQQKANLWVMKQDGSDARFVAELPNMMPVSWSADNQYLAYHSPQPDGSENDIYVLNIASGEITDITRDSPVWDAFPDWSPDGSQIVFTSDRAPEGKALDDVWIVKPDGTGLVNLTDNGTDWEDYHPAWSPDGKSIAFFRGSSLFSENAKGGPAGIWVMDADGKNQKLVTAVDTFRAPGTPVWSPDGKYLAYILGEGEEQDVWVVPLAGGEPVNVSKLAGSKDTVSWAPDSRMLLFTNDDNTNDTLVIYIALADGSDTHPLLPEGTYGYGDWGP